MLLRKLFERSRTTPDVKFPNTISVTDYQFAPADRLFIDASVWLLVHGPQPVADSRVELYTEAYRRILEAKSRIHIDVLVVSEIIHAIVKIRCRLARCGSIKEFTDSESYPQTARETSDVVRRILRCCLRLDDCFASMSIDRIIDEFSDSRSGFNDHVLIDLCKRKSLTLVTDDSDFRGRDIRILTANYNLLR